MAGHWWFAYTVILENPCFWNKNLNDVKHPEFGCWNMVRNNQTDASFNIYIQQMLQQNHDYLKKNCWLQNAQKCSRTECQHTCYKDRTKDKGHRTGRDAAVSLIRRQVSELHRLTTAHDRTRNVSPPLLPPLKGLMIWTLMKKKLSPERQMSPSILLQSHGCLRGSHSEECHNHSCLLPLSFTTPSCLANVSVS